MNIIILSRNPNLYSTRRLTEAGEERGHTMRVVNYLRCHMNITASKPRLLVGSESLNNMDAVIPRIGASKTYYGTAVVRQIEAMNIFSANESDAISRSRDKLRSLQILAWAGIPLPTTGFAYNTDDVKSMIAEVGSTPLVMKLLEGTQGKGVVLAETRKAAESVMSVFRQLDANILVQEFVKEASGRDIRAIVVGRKVVAAMERRAPEGEFRSNVHQGGSMAKVTLTSEERKMVVSATKALGLSIAGVDFMRSNEGPVILEVNSSPGLEGIEKTSKVDVAGAMIDYVVRRVNKKNRL